MIAYNTAKTSLCKTQRRNPVFKNNDSNILVLKDGFSINSIEVIIYLSSKDGKILLKRYNGFLIFIFATNNQKKQIAYRSEIIVIKMTMASTDIFPNPTPKTRSHRTVLHCGDYEK